jgi:glycosyltransferase involved in cell wall biosynthesis
MGRRRRRGRGAGGAVGLSRIRVLRVIARLNLGGPAQQAALLSGRRLDPDRYETLLVHGSLPPGEESMADLAESEGARMERVPSLVVPLRPHLDAAALARTAAIARRFRPHIVHTHTAKAGFIGRTAAIASARPRPRLVHTFHGHVLEGYFGPAREGLYRRLESSLARRTDRLVGVSQATVDDLVRLGVAPPESFRVVRLGLELGAFERAGEHPRAELRRQLGAGDDEVLLSFVGRLVEIKRVDLLLRAVALARSDAPVRLIVVGDGGLRPDLERLAAGLGLGSAVSFLGYRRDLPELAAASDIAVLSSANEGTPVALIEAAAAARPAVATAVGGVAEVVTPETGVLVPAGDERALAEALRRLAADPGLRASMGAAARQRALQRYSAARLIADTDALYRELMAEGAVGESPASR